MQTEATNKHLNETQSCCCEEELMICMKDS